MRGEFDWSEVPYPATQVGTSEAVPTKEPIRNDRQREPMGFKRR